MTSIRPVPEPAELEERFPAAVLDACETSSAQAHHDGCVRHSATEHEEVPMPSIAGGLDIHRKQITFDYVDLDTGAVQCGQIAPADREHFRSWLAGRFEHPENVAFAVEACTGWRYVAGELAAAGITAHLAETADTATQRGRKRRAKTDRADARLMRDLLAAGRLPECWIRRRRSWSAGRCWRPTMTCAASTPPGSSASTRRCSTRARRYSMTSAGQARGLSWPPWPAPACPRPGSSRSCCACGCWRRPEASSTACAGSCSPRPATCTARRSSPTPSTASGPSPHSRATTPSPPCERRGAGVTPEGKRGCARKIE